jgi:N-methylhydantoinase A
LQELEERVRQLLASEGYDLARCVVSRLADLRYSGQAYELTVCVDNGNVDQQTIDKMADRFHKEHEKTYSHCSPTDPVDLINLRVKISITPEGLDASQLRGISGKTDASHGASRKAYFGEYGYLEADLISREQMTTQTRSGPLIIEDYDSTTVVPPDWTARCDSQLTITMEPKP